MRMKRSGFLAMALILLVAFQGGALALKAGFAEAPAVNTTPKPAYTRMLKEGCRGADVKALQQQLNAQGYYKGTADGIFGRGTAASVTAFQKANKLKADGLVGRTTFDAIYSAPAGEDPAPTATPDATSTATPTVTAAATPQPTVTPTYSLGALNNQITLRVGSSGSNVKDLQTVLKMKGFYTGPINGNFQSATKSAVMRFQRSVGLESDGKAGNYTLSALYTMLTPPDLKTIVPWPAGVDTGLGLKVEKLKWADASATAFKRTMTATVLDVRTGYAFHIKRTGGTLHADVETLTPLDTATFYKCTGNFSWNRRPVWVIVGGRRLAASMNCMPHGYDSIAGNDFKGQFCIHFVGSKTHGTGRVDPDHQKCIEEAYQAGLTMFTPAPTGTGSASPTPTPAPTPVNTGSGQLPPP